MHKDELRKKYKKIRKNIENKKVLSKKIICKIFSLVEYINAKTICIYMNNYDEVETTEIIEDALKKGKTVGIPITNESCINFYKIDSIKEVKRKNSFGIAEPSLNSDLILPQVIDLIIVPGICFDLENNRVGFGKGYYDKYLANKELKAIKIGIGFKEQILMDNLIKVNVNDIKMDKIIHN